MPSKSANVTEVACSTSAAVLTSGDSAIFPGGVASQISVFNGSGQTLYLLCGEGDAASDNLTVSLVSGAYWEAPYGYSGRMSGVLASGSGNVHVTEFI